MIVCVAQVLAALFVLVPLCYLSGAFTINPVVEEASQAHHLQLLSGCPPFIYWAGTYVSFLLAYLSWRSSMLMGSDDSQLTFTDGSYQQETTSALI